MAPAAVAASSGSSPTTTNSLQDMSAAAAAIALDMKSNVELAMVPAQKIEKLVSRNASDKLKLIQMVHDTPIFGTPVCPPSRAPRRKFNAPGRRVARAFKSLRESYRRELAHVKLMGNGFKPKWSLYEALDFLRDVIRERKGASHASDLSLSAFAQHLHNNNNNSSNNNNHSMLSGSKAAAACGAGQANQPSYDDMDANSLRSGDEDGGNASDEVEELEAIDADFPYPIILDSNSPHSISGGPEIGQTAIPRKRRRNGETDELEDADLDGDDYEDQMLQQHRQLRQQQSVAAVAGGLELPPPQTVSEVLNSKFCGFISAKLNSMEDSEADNLMNRILHLVVQMQQCEAAT